MTDYEHEDLVVRRGRRSGLTTMIAAHSRVLGPAVGGCRMKPYPRFADAVDDVLRLSRAMSYKCAVAGMAFGGGKSVIALPEGTVLSAARRRDVLLDHADLVASLGGSYLAGPDVGTGPEDMLVLREKSPHVFCLPESHGGTGSSSGPTAVGVLAALRAAARAVFGDESMTGRRVVISGLGAVGTHLAMSLAEAGARLTVSDVDKRKQRVAADRGFEWADPAKAMELPADVLIPAAVGGVFSPEVVARLDAPLVVGPANNQLTDDTVAALLAGRGTVWVPDFVASAGGVVYTLAREIDGLDHEAATARVEAIEHTVSGLLTSDRTPLDEAVRLAGPRLMIRWS
jgi:glutamate dehydrogenase/leucine dehydrogenase